ncbi:MAG: SusC/RagA family TonB-linked outer membrane protein, partial [Bacteroidota bacterium]
MMRRTRKNLDFWRTTRVLGLTFLFLTAINYLAFAQTKTITGSVRDISGEALIGATVVAKGMPSVGMITDIDGAFILAVPVEVDFLEVSYTGFQTGSYDIRSVTTLDVVLEDDLSALAEVVVIGYGTQEKRDVIGAVSSVDAVQLDKRVPTSALEALQGRMAGVQITTASGAPGAGVQIRIRGTSTFEGGVNPLFIVDGQPVDDIENINPADIESMDVLKDGASAAIYGSRSANGVVIITTKSGQSGKPKIDLDYTRSYGQLIGKVPVPNTQQRLDYERLRAGQDLIPNLDSLNATYQNDTDWQELLTQLATRDRINLSVSGGSNVARYYLNVGYLHHKGLMINSAFNRFNTKFNLDITPNDVFKAGLRVTLSSDRFEGLDERQVLRTALSTLPYTPTNDFDGSLDPTTPLARAENEIRTRRNYRTNIFQYVEFKPAKSLSFRSTFGVNFRYQKFENFLPGFLTQNPASGEEHNTLWYDWVHEDYLTYKPDLGPNHSLEVISGVAIQYWKVEFSRLRSDGGFASDLIGTLNNANGFNASSSTSTATEHALGSVFGRAAYIFKDRYMFSATIRRDASSRFGENNRAGNFPAVGLGWRFSDEPLLSGLSRFLDNGKIRANYAITGNERIANFGSQTLYEPGFFYDGTSGIGLVQLGNSDLGWESTKQLNFGLDLAFFNSRLEISSDYYIKTTEDLLFDVPLPTELPVSTVKQNVGSIENRGFELLINATIVSKPKFTWSTNFNIANNRNKVLELSNGVPFQTDIWRIEEGEALGNFFGFNNLGVFAYDESNAFTPEGVQLTPVFENGQFVNYLNNGTIYTGDVVRKQYLGNTLGGGDINWEDTNNDGVIDESDRQVIGNGQAGYFGGWTNDLTFGQFNLTVMFDYSFGNQLFRDFDQDRNAGRWWTITASPEAIQNAWRAQGDVTEYPALNVNDRPANALE